MFGSRGLLDPEAQAAYLARLGVAAEPPSVEALAELVARHVERVPYETLWIAAGERWTVDPTAAAHRIAYEHRGGYCYHLNGGLGLLLQSLGYAVHEHVGGVQAGEPDPGAAGNHLALTVSGLESETNPAGVWYVDVGLGDALHEPLPLIAGEYDQPPFRLRLERSGQDAWTLVHDPAGGFGSMTWTTGPAVEADFTAQHERLSTSPDSGFVRVPMVQRRDATGLDVMRCLTPLRIGSNASTADPITSRAEWFEALADGFGLRVDALAPGSRDRLWAGVVAAHRAWEARRE